VTWPPWPCDSAEWPCDSELGEMAGNPLDGLTVLSFCDCFTPLLRRVAPGILHRRRFSQKCCASRVPRWGEFSPTGISKKSSKAIKTLTLFCAEFAKALNTINR